MYQISQIFIANYGFRDAFFPNRLIDLRKGDDVSSSVMLFAENGRGKTSILSMMLHQFVPGREKFVQHLQKRQSHRFEHYFQEGRPCLYMVEFVRQPKGQLFDKKIPTLVLGIYARKMPDGRIDETYFRFTPIEGVQFDDLEPVKLTRSGERLNWSYADAAAWIKNMKALSEVKPDLIFKTFDVQKLWLEALVRDGFRLNDYNTMLAMATREGGLDAFMTCKDSSDMLGKIHELFVNESDYAEEIAQINHFLDKNKDLPAMQAQLATLEAAVAKEGTFVDQLFVANEAETRLRQVQGELKGLRLVAEAKKATIKDALNQARLAETELATSMSRLERERTETYHRSEASRLAIAAAELADTDAEISKATDARDTANRRKQVHDRIFRDAIRKSELEAHISVLERQIAERQEKQASRLEPVRKAGGRARKLITAAIKAADAKIERNESRRRELRQELENIATATGKLETTKALKEADLKRIEAMVVQQASIRKEIDLALKEKGGEDLAACIAAMEQQIADIEVLISQKQELHSQTSIRLARLEVEIGQQARDVDGLRKSLWHLQTRLSNLNALDAELRAGVLKEITAEDDIDLTSEAYYTGIVSQRGEYSGRAEQLRKEIESLKGRLSAIDGAGSFEDADVLAALSLCQKAGLQSVRPFVLWLSEQNLDAEEARRIVENNIDVALGLIVTDKGDFDKAQSVFDRTSWQLKKPVGLSFFDKAFFDRLKSRDRDPNFFAFSTHNDYAYNSRSKTEVVTRLQEQVGHKSDERSQLLEFVALHDGLIAKLDVIRKICQGRSMDTLADEHSAAAARLAEAEEKQGLLVAQQEELQSVVSATDEEIAAASRKAAAIGEAVKPLIDLRQSMEQVETDLARHEPPQSLEMAINDIKSTITGNQEQKRLFETENEASFEDDKVHVGRRSELTYQSEKIEHFDENSDEDISGWTLDEAVRQYDLAKIEFDRDQDIADLVNMDTEKLTAARTEVTALRNHIEKAFRDIARELSVSELVLHELLSQWFAVDSTDIDTTVSELHRAITGADAELQALNGRKVLLQREAVAKPGYDLPTLKAMGDELRDVDLENLRQIHAEMAAAYVEASLQVEHKIAEQKRLSVTRSQLLEAEKEIGRIEKSLNKNRWDQVEPIANAEIAFDNIETAVRHVDNLLEREERLNDAFARIEKEGNKLHAEIVAFITKEEAKLAVPEVIERFRRFDPASYKSRGEIGRELYHRLGQIGEALLANIELLSTSEAELLVVVGRLYEHALDKILKAVSIKVPSHAKSQFAGNAILQLPDQLTAKALKEYPVDEVARRCIDTIRKSGSAPQVASMAAFSVQLLNIVSNALTSNDFELMILKPVVGAKIQYDVLHKMTGSGGQTITAALLLYLVATNLAGNSTSDELLGFLILDNPIGAANNTQLVQTQLSSAKDFGVQMISTTGILDDYLTAYETVVQFSATAVRNGLTEVDFDIIPSGGTAIEFFDFELHSPAESEAA